MIYDLLRAIAIYLTVTFNTVALLVSHTTQTGIRSFDIIMAGVAFILVYINVRTKNNG